MGFIATKGNPKEYLVTIDCVAMTHNGLVRSGNEDCILCDGWIRNRRMEGPADFSFANGRNDVRVFAVADGLGGHSSGEVASQFALSKLCSAIIDLPSVSEDSIAGVVSDTHKALFAMSTADPSYRCMGTTVAGLVIDAPSSVHLFHVGDSRIYRRQERFLELATIDDRLVPTGYGEAESEFHQTSSLLQCLGGISEFSEIVPHVVRYEMSDLPETFLLCTDGLSDMLTQDEIEESLYDSHHQTVLTLFERVCAAGAKDNVSIMVVSLTPLQAHDAPVISPGAEGLLGDLP
jgi:protein phosphatase